MFMEINIAHKLDRKYVKCGFRAVSEQWPLKKNIRGSIYYEFFGAMENGLNKVLVYQVTYCK